MNDLEERLEAALRRNGAVTPRPMPTGTRAQVRGRRFVRGTGMCVGLAAFVIGVVWAIPHGEPPTGGPADGSPSAVPVPPGWPTVVTGDPQSAYIGPSHGVDGDKYLLTSGTVDGAAFSLVGYSARATDLSVCLEMAGPAETGAPPPSPGPQAPEVSGGVGGFCLEKRVSAVLIEQGWPDFPEGADLVMRPWGQDEKIYMGFATERVARLRIRLADGAAADVALLRFPNGWNFAAFVVFAPSSVIGTLDAFDEDGNLLARARFCERRDGDHGCMPPTQQIAPMNGAA